MKKAFKIVCVAAVCAFFYPRVWLKITAYGLYESIRNLYRCAREHPEVVPWMFIIPWMIPWGLWTGVRDYHRYIRAKAEKEAA